MVFDLSKKAPEITETADVEFVVGGTEEIELPSMFDKVLDIQHQMQLKAYPLVEAMGANERLLISTRALIHEVIEVERELNWKHWKKPVPVDETKLKNEIVDVFIFFMNLVNASGMDSKELFALTLDKIDINIERQKTGY